MADQQRTQFSIRFLFLLIVGSAITALLVQKFGIEKTMPYILTIVLALVLYAIGRWLVMGVEMTSDDPTRPVKLETFNDSYGASMLVSRLEEHEIKATAVGGYVSGFQAESPGYVDVVVVQADVDRAKLLLKEWNQNTGDED